MIINPYRFASGGAYDPDAQAFFTASGLTGATELNAVNQLVLDLKGYGIWTKMKAIYPFVGGTAALHKWNLKDPQDLDAAFRLVFNGGYTHNANGIQGNALNAYADTFLIPNNVLALNSTHVSIYSRTNNTGGYFDIGTNDFISGVLRSTSIGARWPNAQAGTTNNSDVFTYTPTLNSQGLHMISRLISGSYKYYRNTNINTINVNSTSLSIRNIWISAWNNTGGSLYYSNRQYAFASIGDGLTDTEAANFYTAVQAYNTTLSRQV